MVLAFQFPETEDFVINLVWFAAEEHLLNKMKDTWVGSLRLILLCARLTCWLILTAWLALICWTSSHHRRSYSVLSVVIIKKVHCSSDRWRINNNYALKFIIIICNQIKDGIEEEFLLLLVFNFLFWVLTAELFWTISSFTWWKI